jgi:hypothetical protein
MISHPYFLVTKFHPWCISISIHHQGCSQNFGQINKLMESWLKTRTYSIKHHVECHWKCGIKHYIGKKIGTSKLTTKTTIGAWRMPCRIILESFFKEALKTSLDMSLKTLYKSTNCQHKMGVLQNVHKIHKLEALINFNR